MENFFENRLVRQLAKIIGVAGIVIASLMMCQPAQGQGVERGKTESVVQKRKHSNIYIVCIRSSSGKLYKYIHRAHCGWNCKPNISETWDIITTRKNKTFIKPVL